MGETSVIEQSQEEKEAQAIYDAIMPSVRGGMWERRLSFDTADRIAECVYAGALQYVRQKENNDG
jgi:hypothetical protein